MCSCSGTRIVLRCPNCRATVGEQIQPPKQCFVARLQGVPWHRFGPRRRSGRAAELCTRCEERRVRPIGELPGYPPILPVENVTSQEDAEQTNRHLNPILPNPCIRPAVSPGIHGEAQYHTDHQTAIVIAGEDFGLDPDFAIARQHSIMHSIQDQHLPPLEQQDEMEDQWYFASLAEIISVAMESVRVQRERGIDALMDFFMDAFAPVQAENPRGYEDLLAVLMDAITGFQAEGQLGRHHLVEFIMSAMIPVQVGGAQGGPLVTQLGADRRWVVPLPWWFPNGGPDNTAMRNTSGEWVSVRRQSQPRPR